MEVHEYEQTLFLPLGPLAYKYSPHQSLTAGREEQTNHYP
jgi:hypothetical protein